MLNAWSGHTFSNGTSDLPQPKAHPWAIRASEIPESGGPAGLYPMPGGTRRQAGRMSVILTVPSWYWAEGNSRLLYQVSRLLGSCLCSHTEPACPGRAELVAPLGVPALPPRCPCCMSLHSSPLVVPARPRKCCGTHHVLNPWCQGPAVACDGWDEIKHCKAKRGRWNARKKLL